MFKGKSLLYYEDIFSITIHVTPTSFFTVQTILRLHNMNAKKLVRSDRVQTEPADNA